jgi:hypothetical protein
LGEFPYKLETQEDRNNHTEILERLKSILLKHQANGQYFFDNSLSSAVKENILITADIVLVLDKPRFNELQNLLNPSIIIK